MRLFHEIPLNEAAPTHIQVVESRQIVHIASIFSVRRDLSQGRCAPPSNSCDVPPIRVMNYVFFHETLNLG